MAANIPGLDADRMRWSYPELFMYTLIWNVSLAVMSATLVWLILLVLKWRIVIRNKNRIPTDSSLNEVQSKNENSGQINEDSDRAEQVNLIPKPAFNRWHKLLVVSTSVFYYLMVIGSSLIFLAAFMFGVIGFGNGKDVLAVFIMVILVVVPTLVWKMLTRTRSHSEMRKQYIVTLVLLLLWVGVSIAGVIMTKRACLCVFNDLYGVKINKDFKLSTEFSRSGRGKICQDNTICHIYATLPEDTDTSVFFNFHTGTDVAAVEVAIKPADQYEKNPIFDNVGSATQIIVGEQLEQNGQRNVFSILFNNLKPGTDHIVRIQAGNGITIFTKYRTLPSYNSTDEMRVAFGGDVGMTDIGSDLTLYLTDFDPHAIIIGGDVAYDDAMPSCYYSWDTFYQIFEGLNNKLNRIVPLILSVGNHDVGFDSLATVQVSPDKEGPFFFAFHPQQYADLATKSGIPDIENRSSSHFHRMGKILMMNLDSGYLQSFQDQKSFIEKTSQAHKSYQRIANYHNPIYPTCSNSDSQPERNVLNLSRTHWVPLFQDLKFIASMQHHTHHFKYTHPITNGSVDTDNGVVYIGDGCWGVYNEICPEHNKVTDQIFATPDSDNSEHVWMMVVKKDSIDFRALDSDGNTRYQNTRNFRVLG